MSLRMGMSVGGTTDVSSLSDQVRRYKARTFDVSNNKNKAFERAARDSAAREPLTKKCIRVITENFERLPALEGGPGGIPAKFIVEVSAGLNTDLDPQVAALYVFDENYWKRRCIEKLGWLNCQLIEHGLTWKQLFFEHHVAKRLEEFEVPESERGANAPPSAAFTQLLGFLTACQDYVFTLQVKQLLSHPDMQAVCACLPNLTCLDVTYGVRSIGMQYERMLFGMKISDAGSLAKTIQGATCLTTAILQCNLIDDDLLRMLMTGLIKNTTITHLDVSHNKITNHGARLLSKLLSEKSVLTALNLADNQIHAEGGRYLGRALRSNDSLEILNLRLNRLTDEGGRMLLEGLRDNTALSCLNLSGNSIASDSCSTLGILLQQPSQKLAVLDLSCNELQVEDLRLLKAAIETNTTITCLDLRMNDIAGDMESLEAIEALVHRNELARRDQP